MNHGQGSVSYKHLVLIMSNMNIDKIMQSPDLPSPTGVALKVMELSIDENSTTEQIAEVIELDPAISSRLLKLVNSPFTGATRQVASVSRAVSLVGVRTVSSLAMGFSLVKDHREGQCEEFDFDLFWSEAVARACSARHLANALKNFAPDEAFTCGLLSSIGKLAFASIFPEKYSRVLQKVEQTKDDELVLLEQKIFCIDHHQLAAAMMDEWHMPDIFVNAVRHQGKPETFEAPTSIRELQFAKMLHLSGNFAYVLTCPVIYRNILSSMILKANGVGILPEVCKEIFDSICVDWRESGTIFSVPTKQISSFDELYANAKDQPEAALT